MLTSNLIKEWLIESEETGSIILDFCNGTPVYAFRDKTSNKGFHIAEIGPKQDICHWVDLNEDSIQNSKLDHLTLKWLPVQQSYYDSNFIYSFNSGEFREIGFVDSNLFLWARAAIDTKCLTRVLLYVDKDGKFGRAFAVEYDAMEIFKEDVPDLFGDFVLEIIFDYVAMLRKSFAHDEPSFDIEIALVNDSDEELCDDISAYSRWKRGRHKKRTNKRDPCDSSNRRIREQNSTEHGYERGSLGRGSLLKILRNRNRRKRVPIEEDKSSDLSTFIDSLDPSR